MRELVEAIARHVPSYPATLKPAAPEENVYLDTGWDPAEPRVVRFESWGEVSEENEDFRVAFSSLPEMWFSFAFLELRMPLLPWRASYGPGRQDPGQEPVPYMERLDWLARKLGFERLPYTTQIVPCYERGDAALMGFMPNSYSMSMRLAAREEQELRRIEQLLEDHACVVRSGN